MIALLAAPTNLGLRPPAPGLAPGTWKAPKALRDAGLFERFLGLGALDTGTVVPGPYRADVSPGTVRNQEAIIDYSRRLGSRIRALRAGGLVPLVVGGDCSLLLGAGVALGKQGRYGLVHLDGHTDFRHPGISAECANLAGEDLAAAVGRHWPPVADIDGLSPYFLPTDTVHCGCRDDDEHLMEARETLSLVIPASTVGSAGTRAAAHQMARILEGPALAGYWLHLDVDILDPTWMPAVDSPASEGLTLTQLTELLHLLAPRAVGADVTVYDPERDADGRFAAVLVDLLVAGLRDLGSDL